MLLAYIPYEILREFSSEEIAEAIKAKIEEKAEREGIESLYILALNEAILFEAAYGVLTIQESILRTEKKAREAARRAEEKSSKAWEEAKKAREVSEKVMKMLERLVKELEKRS